MIDVLETIDPGDLSEGLILRPHDPCWSVLRHLGIPMSLNRTAAWARGPGVMLLDRTRLPGKQAPATVGAGAKVGGGAVVAGVKVGEGAYVAAGETVED